MRIMFTGTSSNAGKTMISAIFCRYLRSRMVMVSPFKGSNLSSISYMTQEGEIGIGQALQAWASDIVPDVRINPVLMKAENGKIRLFVNGKEKGRDAERNELLSAALGAYDELCDMYDAVVVEGSGSPAEINLREKDIANMGLAAARQIPVIIVGDIEKGGVFAGIYGTWRLIKEEDKHLLKGFIINKYYGSKEILKSGIERIESLTGMKCLGVLPYLNAALPDEDSHGRGVRNYSDDEINAFLGSLDRILENISDHLDMDMLIKIAEE
ncbi:MAG: AAA family ATPase [Methanomassiliicoccaceae archaeon]|jgi:adenosylcobyric acid synthase|nr:AAA family ATPase [Methanomassiliicoccaceae archaeon]